MKEVTAGGFSAKRKKGSEAQGAQADFSVLPDPEPRLDRDDGEGEDDPAPPSGGGGDEGF